MKLIILALAVFSLATGCGVGSLSVGNSQAVQTFYATVKTGSSLVDAVIAGEKAQHFDIKFRVFGRAAPDGDIEIGRYWQEPYIRITKAPPNSAKSARPYKETGYATREDFAHAVAETLPLFYPCKTFRFTFNRYQGGSNSDSFTVEVDTNGLIKSVSPLEQDRVD